MDRLVRASLLLLTVALLLALGAYAWRAAATRYFMDDFCSATNTRMRGFLGTMEFQRAHWSGRYAYFAIKFPLEQIGPETAPFTPAAILILMTVAAVWGMRGLAHSRLLALTAGCALAFAAVDSAPAVFDDYGPFVWETGALTYMLPTVLFVFWGGLLVREPSEGTRAWPAVLASFLLLFVAGGLSETSLAAQGVMAAGALLLSLLKGDPVAVSYRRKIAIAGFLGTSAALALAASAPGNAVRAQGLPPRGPLGAATLQALDLANRFVGFHIFVEGASLLIVAVIGILLGATRSRVRAIPAAAIAVMAALCYLVSFIPSTWFISAPPPPRAQYVASFFSIVCVLAAAAAVAAWRRDARIPPFAAAALLLLIVVPLGSAAGTVQTIDAAQRDAARREHIMRLLSTQRGKDVVLRSKWALESRFLGPDVGDPNTYCVRAYYGLRSLRVIR
ncbi:MAG: DUF6056 family protein [Acidobacteriota bacterium]